MRNKSKRRNLIESLEPRLLLSRTIYVDVSASGATHDGTSWASAFTDLQQGLAAAVSGDEIHVADGTYKPTSGTDRTISFALKSGVKLLGGYAGFGAAEPDARDTVNTSSVLSGDIGVIGNNADNSYHVLTAAGFGSTTVMDGFTITLGNANQYGTDQGHGGGLLLKGSPAMTLNDCTFSQNAALYGGGIYNDFATSSPLVLTNCAFSGNTAGSGGAVADESQALSTMTGCRFTGNTASSSGGGLYYWSSTGLLLTACSFVGNTAGSDGGGMLSVNHSTPTVTGCTFIGNKAASGGGLWNGTTTKITNCIITANTATNGGGMYNYNSSVIVTNSTFSGNYALTSGDEIYNYCTSASSPTRLTNCIVWGRLTTQLGTYGVAPIITYSNIQGGSSGAGNINVDPQFIRSPWTGPDGAFGTADDDYGDLRLRTGSACLDSGSNAAVPAGVTTDLVGNVRIQNGKVDLGAYEGGFSASATKVMYVDQSSVGANDGTSWTNAFTNLQSAILAARDGDTIRIADGTYKPTITLDRTITFALRSGVSLYGGYAGYGSPTPDARDIAAYPTILCGDIGSVGNNADNSYHVATATGVGISILLSGLTIIQGNANGTGINQDSGAGLLANESISLNLIDCTFSGNIAKSRGGGFCSNYSSAILTHCTFAGNTGSGMYNNLSSPVLTDCAFIRNSVGGMCNANSSPTLTNCIFSGNIGGGVVNSFSSPKLTNCAFSGNTAMYGGGGMYNSVSSPTLINCTFSGNCTTGGNPDLSYGGAMYSNSSRPVLTNCIIWGSGANPIYDHSSSIPTITNSDIQGGYAGVGNINVDPQFMRSPWIGLDGLFGTTDDDYGDLSLRSGSPCLDVGSNAAVPVGVTTDLAGNVRIQNGKVDMGAYEGGFTAAPSRVVYVDHSSVGANDGTSWTDAYTSLQSAVLAAQDGDTIRIAGGTYKPTMATDRTITFALKSGVSLYGGYAGYGALNPDARDISAYPTILSGDIGAVGNNADNSYHVLTATGIGAPALVNGLAVTLGNADGTVGTHQDNGAGLLAFDDISLNLIDCTFSGNIAKGRGSGFYSSYSSAILDHCTFTQNIASDTGGGMYNNFSSPVLTNCAFSGNAASSGGAMWNYASSSPTLTGCTFSGNTATSGGAIYNDHSSSILTRCTFSLNAASSGGGIYYEHSSSIVTNCSFTGNTAITGAGIYNKSSSSLILTNCTFGGNWGGNVEYSYGGGMFNSASSPTLTNCTFGGNAASWGGAMDNIVSSPTLTNCILWGNGSIPISNSNCTPIITYSDIQGGYSGTGNINRDPVFIAGAFDLRVRSTSPCIDAGDNGAVPPGVTTDLLGNPRIVDAPGVQDYGERVDMGAYEYLPPLTYQFNAAKPMLQMTFEFDMDPVTLSTSDLLLLNVTSGQPLGAGPAAVTYDAVTRTATWNFASALPDGQYRATLPAGSVSDIFGTPLWSDAFCNFFVLGGDANRDRKVDINDLAILASNWQGTGKLFSQGDFNYDGKVDATDLGILSSHWQQALPPPPAAGPVSVVRAPTRTPVRMVSVVP